MTAKVETNGNTNVATSPVSIFSNSTLFTNYGATLQFRGKVLGGIPQNPKVIEAWLRKNLGVTNQEEIRRMMFKTLTELGAEVDPNMSDEELEKASSKVAAVKQTNSFKQNGQGLYIEDRQVKAMLREAVNILYAGEKWGVTKKGPKNFTAERVFVTPAEIPLGRMEPDGVELMIVHASTPQGPRSSLAYHAFVDKPTISFKVRVARDSIKKEHWDEILELAQELGLGASRSQSFGRFDVTKWEVVG